MNKSCIIIAGPTAVGKTAISLQLAKGFSTQIHQRGITKNHVRHKSIIIWNTHPESDRKNEGVTKSHVEPVGTNFLI